MSRFIKMDRQDWIDEIQTLKGEKYSEAIHKALDYLGISDDYVESFEFIRDCHYESYYSHNID